MGGTRFQGSRFVTALVGALVWSPCVGAQDLPEAEYPAARAAAAYPPRVQPPVPAPAPVPPPQTAPAPPQSRPFPPSHPAPPPLDPEESVDADTLDNPFLAVDGHLGLGAPTGFVGAMVDFAPLPYLAVGAGLGLGRRGLQLAAGARVRMLIWKGGALALGAGVSAGPYQTDQQAPCIFYCESYPALRWDPAIFGNVDVSFEQVTRNHLHLRTYIGISHIMNPDSASCSAAYMDLCHYVPDATLYIGCAIGRVWFL